MNIFTCANAEPTQSNSFTYFNMVQFYKLCDMKEKKPAQECSLI